MSIPASSMGRALLLLAAALLLGCSGSTRAPEGGMAGGSAAAGAGAGTTANAAQPRVIVHGGELEGRAVTENVHAFFGIPYATAPVGRLRFGRPEPHAGWPGVRDAGVFASRCPQQPASAQGESEDCLYLNVWTPANAPQSRLPVMVWMHGGGNTTGSAGDPAAGPESESLYDGARLSERHGVVVVTFNYRLGVFGFFSHPALEGEGMTGGNQGLWDQQLALRWVQQNVASFGGDPANVTIFGESAGSLDVCLHVVSPRSRGLFHRAISQSGACTTRRRTAAEAEPQGNEVAMQLGCTGSEELPCLRAKAVGELLDLASGVFAPVVDGDFVPDQPRALFDRGEVAAVPYIVGTNSDEGSGFVLDAADVNEASYLTQLAARFPPPVEEIAQRYPASAFAGALNPHFAALARAVGDARFVCVAHDTALRAHAAGLTVYAYNFDVPIDGPDGVLGAVHAFDLGFVFGTWPMLAPETQAVSDRMMAYWTEFARKGDPNVGDLLAWPRFTDSADVRMNFGLQSSVVTDFRAAECAFWRRRYDAAFEVAAP